MQPFKQVMVPVADIKFFHPSFQFSFVNKASINVNDDVWNVDYVRMAANRNMYDTLVNDIAWAENKRLVDLNLETQATTGPALAKATSAINEFIAEVRSMRRGAGP